MTPLRLWFWTYRIHAYLHTRYMLTTVLVAFPLVWWKHHDQNQLWEKRVYFSLQRMACHPGRQGRSTELEAGGRNWFRGHWRGAACWPDPHSLFSLLSYTFQDHASRGDSVCTRMASPTVIINWWSVDENAPQACPQATLVGHFLNWGSFSQNNCGLCHNNNVDITTRLHT